MQDTSSAPEARDAAPAWTISQAARIGEIHRASTALLAAIALSTAALAAWAWVAEVDTVAQAPGRIVPSARLQQVQSLEGGIVSRIHVQAGQQVSAGAPLVTLSPLQAGADLDTRRQQTLALAARAARLQAEAEGGEPAFGALADGAAAELARAEAAAFRLRRAELGSQQAMADAQVQQRLKELEEARVTVQTAERTLAAAREERTMLERLVAQGLEPRMELVRLERVISEAEGRSQVAQVTIGRLQQAIIESRARRDGLLQAFRAAARDELARTLADLRSLEQGLPALADRVDRTVLAAPLRGTVNRVHVATVGGVARPGDPLVDLVPADDPLVIEAMASPRDIGFIRVGQKARIKLSAYDFSIFGALDGAVQQVGADAVTNERGESWFVVRIEARGQLAGRDGRPLVLVPGMQGQVDIVTGRKTVADVLLKPLVGVRENAFRER